MTISETKPISPYLLIALGVVIGAGITSILASKTSMFQKQEKYAQSTPTPAVTATPLVTQSTTPEATPSITITPTPSFNDIIKAELLSRTNIPEGKLEFTVGEKSNLHARGSVRNKDDISGAAWFAAYNGTVWKVVYDGQGVPLCSEVEQWSFPKAWISHCVDANSNTKAL